MGGEPTAETQADQDRRALGDYQAARGAEGPGRGTDPRGPNQTTPGRKPPGAAAPMPQHPGGRGERGTK